MSGQYEEALAAAMTEDCDTGRVEQMLRAARDHGDSRATYALATWYLHGKHFRRNLRMAVGLFREAARADVPDAIYDLAVCFEEGIGVRMNLQLAARLYVRAALLGQKQAVFEVGRCYYYGIGVGRDTRMGNIWLDRAKTLGID